MHARTGYPFAEPLMPTIFLADHHDQVYTFWKEHGMRGLSVAHVDSHCDMRGLLIDRPNQRACFK